MMWCDQQWTSHRNCTHEQSGSLAHAETRTDDVMLSAADCKLKASTTLLAFFCTNKVMLLLYPL